MRFADRRDAGRRLAQALLPLAGQDVVVLGLPRGGLPVASEVARVLGAPLDVIVVRALRAQDDRTAVWGAIGEDGARIVDDDLVRRAGVTEQQLADVERWETAELERRIRRFRGHRRAVPLVGRTAVVVDDGIMSGATARAACWVARARGAGTVVFAAPVGPEGVERQMRPAADRVICLHTPAGSFSIGQFYDDVAETTDEQVVDLLRRAAPERAAGPAPLSAPLLAPRDEEVRLRAGRVQLRGHLTVPEGAAGVVVFAHGSGSSRHSPRNRSVAATLNTAGLGTLLFDLLAVDEEPDRGNVFDIDLLARRLRGATAWLRTREDLRRSRIGYFGASTGAAAALWAAAEPDADIAAVVSRGGRPDLAGPRLGLVRAPTLLVVGSDDHVVLRLNRLAAARLRCESRLHVVPGASHLFDEPGTLEQAAQLASEWFTTHLARGPDAGV